MLIVHHLNHSRSQRVLWLLEELELPYEIKAYERNAQSNLAPPELETIHPLGKSPVVEDDGLIVHESAAIIDYLLRHHGQGRLRPAADSAQFEPYQQWMHYAEGSAMLPLMLRLYVSRLGDAGAPLFPRIQDETSRHLGYVDAALKDSDWLLGDDLSGADIQMSFVGEVAASRAQHELSDLPNLLAWVRRFQSRPAYRRAIERGGPYRFVV